METESVSRVETGTEPGAADRIVAAARERFLRYGFSRVTVDEIAGDVGMSKKTIYRSFGSKAEIIRAAVRMTMSEFACPIQELMRDPKLDFVEKLRQLMTILGVRFQRFDPEMMRDLQHAAPHVWREIEEFRRKMILENFGRLVDEGMQRGFFRADIDRGILVDMYLSTVQEIMNPSRLAGRSMSMKQAFETIIKIVFEGLLTSKGRARFDARNRREKGERS